MILTVTMNPSVDIMYQLETLDLNTINRSKITKKTAGGKGLNVARVAKLMNEEVTTTGILGGTVGQFISLELKNLFINEEFLHTSHESRNCIAVLHNNSQTEILEEGPHLSIFEESKFLEKFKNILDNLYVNVITISGSIPKGLKSSIYNEMIILANKKRIPVLLDCSESLLIQTLKSKEKPFLIKPNETELKQLMDINFDFTLKNAEKVLNSSVFEGIKWVVVSMGAKGAFIKHNDKFYITKLPKINAVNPVGSGDASVAGFAVSFVRNLSVIDTIKTAMTAGLLNALEEKTGFINPNNFKEYFEKIIVEEYIT